MKRFRRRFFSLNEPLKHPDHRRPLTRREFIAQGFMAGGATVVGGSIFSLFSNPHKAYAALSSDIANLQQSCGIATVGAGKIPFICFDLAGGANIAGSNVLVGQRGGQLDFLSTAGYSKLGLPGDMTPNIANPTSNTRDYINVDLGLAFHSDSAMLRGILSKTSAATRANTNGVVIPAVSENDTANNPHNPMYAIWRAGADGSLLTLIGSRNSDSGGNSIAPMEFFDPTVRPTKIDRASDVTGLVDIGDLVGLLDADDAIAVMESITRISNRKLDRVDTKVARDAVIKELVRCGYVKSAVLAEEYSDPAYLNPSLDTDIVGNGGIFTPADYNGDDEFRKTAAVMKMVVNGFAGAGTITMGGFDYHTGDRATGEQRDFRAGQCIGACLEYAARAKGGAGVPIMIYVFSDGSVSSNGMADDSMLGRGKGQWTGDNSSTAASFFLVYNPSRRPALIRPNLQQLGHMRPDGSVETAATPASNNVNLLVQTVALNYMALHGEQGAFVTAFPNHGLGSSSLRDSLTSFSPIVNGVITSPA
jgi:hypothetical protein